MRQDDSSSHSDSQPRRSKRRQNGQGNGNGSHSHSASHEGIPFRDADTDAGEIPLDELDTFVIPGTDELGRGEHMQFRIPPYLRRQIKIILSSNRFPYLAESNFIRHAIVRHLYWLVELRNTIPKHMLPALAGVLEVCRDDEMRIYVEQVFERIDSRISFHLSRGDHGEVVRLLNLVKSRMSGVAQSAWQRQFWKHFNEKWSGYLTAEPIKGGQSGVH
jgi:hypothetical protein